MHGGTLFWSNDITDWEQIHAPSAIGESTLDGLKLDWRRFVSDQILDFCKEERDVDAGMFRPPGGDKPDGGILSAGLFQMGKGTGYRLAATTIRSGITTEDDVARWRPHRPLHIR